MPNVRVPEKMCATCVFKPKQAKLLKSIRHRWEKGGHQQCHAFIIAGESRYDERGFDRNVMCRGFYEFEAGDDFREFVEKIPGLLEMVSLPETPDLEP